MITSYNLKSLIKITLIYLFFKLLLIFRFGSLKMITRIFKSILNLYHNLIMVNNKNIHTTELNRNLILNIQITKLAWFS